MAKTWAARRELESQEKEVFLLPDPLLISDLILAYLDEFDTDRSKKHDLFRLSRPDIATKDIYSLTSTNIITHGVQHNQTAKPQMVKIDVIWLKTVLQTIRTVLSYDYFLSIFDTANQILRKEGLIAKADKPDRRPTNLELMKLGRYFYHKKTLNL